MRAKCINCTGNTTTGIKRALFAAGNVAMTKIQAERLIMALHLIRLAGVHPAMDSSKMLRAYRKIGGAGFDKLEVKARELKRRYVHTR